MLRMLKIFIFLLVVALLFFPVDAFADGDGNVDTGGGTAGDSIDKGGYWPGNQHSGYRVSVYDKSTGKIKGYAADYLTPEAWKCFLQVKIPHFCKYFSPCRGGEFLCKPLQDSFQIFSTP